MKNYSLGLYEKSMPGAITWADRLHAAKYAGFDFVEISIDETDEKLARLHWDRTEKEALLRDMKISGCSCKKHVLKRSSQISAGERDKIR